MADREKKFTVSIFAPEGDLRQRELNIQDSLFDATDPFSNRLKFVSQPAPPLSVLEQQIVERLQNQPQQFLDVLGGNYPAGSFPLSVNQDPSIAPFPIGCPTGFYQSGNVCVPIVGTYPDETTNAPPGGMAFAKGTIQYIKVSPALTQRGKQFQIQAFFVNEGGINGRFYTRISIPQLDITNIESSGVLVPKLSQAVINKIFFMPTDAPLSTIFLAQVELLRLDPDTGSLVVDDAGTVDVPSPETEIPAGNDSDVGGNGNGGTTPTCPTGFELNEDGLCVQVQTVPNCPTGYHLSNEGYCIQDVPEGPSEFDIIMCQLGNAEACERIGIPPPSPDINCPFGYSYQNGVCVEKPCPQGYVFNNGICKPAPAEVACPTGYEKNAQGLCVQIPPEEPTVPTCPPGYQYNSTLGACMPIQCPSGYEYDIGLGLCKQIPAQQCPEGYELNSSGLCVQKQCPTGYHYDQGLCVQNAPTTPAPINCPPGYHADSSNTYCLQDEPQAPQCPPGYHAEGNYCVQDAPQTPAPPQCPSGYHAEGQYCVQNAPSTPNCPSGYHLEGNLCVQNAPTSSSCPPGFTLQGNVCIQSSCPPGYELHNGICYASSSTGGGGGGGTTTEPPPTNQCNSSLCSSVFNGSCGTECNNNPNNTSQKCRDCIAVCCSKAFSTRGYHGISYQAYQTVSMEPASLTLVPSGSVEDCQFLTIKGFSFNPGEAVDIAVEINWHGRYDIENRKTRAAGYQNASSFGSFMTQVKIPCVPEGIYGFATIVARGNSSMKIATETIDVT